MSATKITVLVAARIADTPDTAILALISDVIVIVV